MANYINIQSIPEFTKSLMERYSIEEIEGSLVTYILEQQRFDVDRIKGKFLLNLLSKANPSIIYELKYAFTEINLEILVDIFEAMLDKSDKSENGIVFTPMFIVEYIIQNVFNKVFMTRANEINNYLQGINYNDKFKIIDPACGCGIFLLGALEHISKSSGISKRTLIEKHLYGIDLNPHNIRRCKIILTIASLLDGDTGEDINFNLVSMNSLESNWNDVFNVQGFDYIIGNPPYVNTHDMNKETIDFLKKNFLTTQSGVFNIFYAFIEHSMKFLKNNGCLGFIIPNNFLTIKSAESLRSYIQKNKFLKAIVDFDENMVFKPVRTYNAIIILDKNDNNEFYFKVLNKVDDIKAELLKHDMHKMEIKKLDKNGWKLIHGNALDNINKIENQLISIKNFIRTGIATLRDNVYIIKDQDDNGYYKELDGKKFYIEKQLIKTLYKVSDIKDEGNIIEFRKHIIFPYKKGKIGFEIIPEDEMKSNYPVCYEYLVAMKEELDKRDKGKPNPVAWYAYGRTQGLNKYGKKLLFPTFSKKPKFMLEEDDTALFCNGYAIFENDYIELRILSKILNSVIMEYYVNNTSYSIEGGYRCYQKKYIENFSIPLFSQKEIDFLSNEENKEVIDKFLVEKYNLKGII